MKNFSSSFCRALLILNQAKPAAAITKSSSSSTATAAAPSETFDNIEDMVK